MTANTPIDLLATLKELSEKNYLLFAPRKGRDLKTEYSELNQTEQFKRLSKDEMLFVWYMACVSSPFAEFKDEEKLDTVIDLSFPKKFRDAKRTEYQGRSFPTHIREALVKMRSYDLPHRLRNRVFCEQFYANLEHISKVKVADENGSDPSLGALDREQLERLTKAISELPDTDRHVVVLYYHEQLYLKEIGKILGVTESRVSQILTRATERLRLKLKEQE